MRLLLEIIAIAIAIYITWDTTRAEWRCYHCGFCTNQEDEAQAHFGDDQNGEPLCVFWYRQSPEERLKEFQSVVRELDGEREEVRTLRQQNETLEYRVGNLEFDIRTRFPGCTCLQDVWNKMDSLRGEVLSAREQITSDEFWKRACPSDEQPEWIACELREYRQLVTTLAEVYPYISGGRLISLDTTAEGVKKAVDRHYGTGQN